ncbi:hypothetical protein DFQ30_007562 [Apophysomyces sp. BC1015]|nr:hypothetical protein DFQ30_007562 [Apophysomyces sp. BC1015]
MELNVFKPDATGGEWRCPFCLPPEFVLKTPPISNRPAMEKVRLVIGKHLDLHRSDVLGHMSSKDIEEYEKSQQESIRRARILINGTVADRKLYM